MKSKTSFKSFWFIISILLIGACVGWLTGMSISPVASVIISSLILITSNLIAFMSGLNLEKKGEQNLLETKENEEKIIEENPEKITENKKREKSITNIFQHSKVNPIPFAFLVIGITGGVALGIYTRTHNLLGTSLYDEVNEWKLTGLSDTIIARELFEEKMKMDMREEIPYFEKSVLMSYHSSYRSKICGNNATDMFRDLILIGKKNMLDSLLDNNSGDSIKVMMILKKECQCKS